MTDNDIIEGKIDIISENLEYLEDVRNIDREDFVSSFEKIQATKHCLLEAIEACLDIANHIIASEGFPRVEEYGEFFRVLGDEGVISKDLANRLVGMAKFRNLLVHRYGLVKPEELHRILNEDLGDIREYVREVARYMGKK